MGEGGLEGGDDEVAEFGRGEDEGVGAPFEEPGEDFAEGGDGELDADAAGGEGGGCLGAVPAAGEGVGADGAGELDDDVVAVGAGDEAEGAVEEVVDVEVGREVEVGAADGVGGGEALDGEDAGVLAVVVVEEAAGDDVEAVAVEDEGVGGEGAAGGGAGAGAVGVAEETAVHEAGLEGVDDVFLVGVALGAAGGAVDDLLGEGAELEAVAGGEGLGEAVEDCVEVFVEGGAGEGFEVPEDGEEGGALAAGDADAGGVGLEEADAGAAGAALFLLDDDGDAGIFEGDEVAADLRAADAVLVEEIEEEDAALEALEAAEDLDRADELGLGSLGLRQGGWLRWPDPGTNPASYNLFVR